MIAARRSIGIKAGLTIPFTGEAALVRNAGEFLRAAVDWIGWGERTDVVAVLWLLYPVSGPIARHPLSAPCQ
jgi:hypothetical protein